MPALPIAALLAAIGVPAAQVAYLAAVEAVLAGQPRRRAAAVRPWLWLAPALLFILVFLCYPAAATATLSLFGPDSRTFVGLRNYAAIALRPELSAAVGNTLVWLAVFPGLVIALGLGLAVLADRVPYDAAVRTACFVPMAVSFVAAGVTWKFVYAFRPPGLPQIGLLNALLVRLVPGFAPVAWLTRPGVDTLALILVATWVWMGFCLAVFSAALKAVPADLLDAARVDGATERGGSSGASSCPCSRPP